MDGKLPNLAVLGGQSPIVTRMVVSGPESYLNIISQYPPSQHTPDTNYQGFVLWGTSFETKITIPEIKVFGKERKVSDKQQGTNIDS